MHSMIKYYKQKVKVEQILGKLTSNVKTKHLKGYNPQQYGTVLKSTKKTNYRPGSKVLIATILGEWNRIYSELNKIAFLKRIENLHHKDESTKSHNRKSKRFSTAVMVRAHPYPKYYDKNS